ncbi:hypothetical protein VFPPC_17727 [Pochonia chlamydosporia 170]|uniref:Uncharacterized protein n=1 Tax=Pochonia chlamydosporia 170 TaxID=1380566 RepID=A0A219AQN7_METCM|nr:hypothetical protein VFPPC_17727 [Pochonia chlamydosporia 170]OWT43097.1 hypothetical protein VFPPC_17727 [Pochonia chlamydosporia 170]
MDSLETSKFKFAQSQTRFSKSSQFPSPQRPRTSCALLVDQVSCCTIDHHHLIHSIVCFSGALEPLGHKGSLPFGLDNLIPAHTSGLARPRVPFKTRFDVGL